jgi:hypothetical protein
VPRAERLPFTLTAIGCGRSAAGPYCIDQCPERSRYVTVVRITEAERRRARHPVFEHIL